MMKGSWLHILLLICAYYNGFALFTKDGPPGMEKKYPLIEFEVKGILNMQVGDSHIIKATYFESKEKSREVQYKWTVAPGLLGTLSAEGKFVAQNPGFGEIIAEYEQVYAKLKVRVASVKEEKPDKFPFLMIVTKRAELKVGDFVELFAYVVKDQGQREVVEASWKVQPDSLAQFKGDSLFATAPGTGIVYAEYGELKDSIALKVKDISINEKPKVTVTKYGIFPQDTSISTGEKVTYQLFDSEGKIYSGSVKWQVLGKKVGEISSNGIFTAHQPGVGVVQALIDGKRSITTRVVVAKDTLNSFDLNVARFFRVLPKGIVLPEKQIKEGGSYIFRGFPYPLNVLNGGLLHLPVGSLKEDISIYMTLPQKVKGVEENEELTFPDSVVNGVKFIVMVDNQPVEPYYFGKPLHLSLVYKHELLDSLGIPPEHIGMFFDENGDYTASGISDVLIDSASNRILAQVEHFSTLVIKYDNSLAANNTVVVNPQAPISYPNPFTHFTQIKYSVTGLQPVIFTILNQTGQTMKKVVIKPVAEGLNTLTWEGDDTMGNPVNPGIYFGVLQSGDQNFDRYKMVKR